MATDSIGTIALDNANDVALADRLKNGREQILSEVRKLIIGQEEVVEQVLLTLFVGGNSIIVGVRASRRPCSSTRSRRCSISSSPGSSSRPT